MENTIEGVKPEVAEEASEARVRAENAPNGADRKPEAGSDSVTEGLSVPNMSCDSGAGAPGSAAPPSNNDIPVPVEMPLDPLSQLATPGPGVTADPSNNGKKEGSRRVSFPEDGRIVSGYMDPPSPWNDAATCSTDELLLAYRAACDKFGVRPMPSLVQQLKAITDFSDRNETLTFRGERIDHKHCETLEEILRRVQFRTIDLEATHLEEEGAIALFDMIEYYESCIRINVSYNRGIGPRGWQSCARMLKKTPCIEHLEARNCHITEQVMPMLGRALRMGSMLTTLHMENSMLSGRPLMILVAAIKMNDILREVFLADNKLMPSDGIQLGNMLKVNHNLHLLDLRNNHLQDVGTSHICDGMYEQNLGRGLNTLVLWNNQITYQAMPSFSRALVSTRCLETLNLGHNNITNEGIHRLKNGLLANKSLQRIGLQAAKISCEGAVALAEYIADSQKLLRLDLRENDIKTGGLMALSLSLKVSQSVTRIDLDKDPKKESGVRDYAEQQHRLLTDITNYMQRNRDLARQREEEDELRRQQEEVERQQRELEEAEREVAAEVAAEVQELEASQKAEKERENETHASAKSNLHLDLSTASPARSQSLESPGFIPESELPIEAPPAEQVVSVGWQQPVKRDFPPSPMVSSNGKPVLAAVLGGMVGSDMGFPLEEEPAADQAADTLPTIVETETLHGQGQPTGLAPDSAAGDSSAGPPSAACDGGTQSEVSAEDVHLHLESKEPETLTSSGDTVGGSTSGAGTTETSCDSVKVAENIPEAPDQVASNCCAAEEAAKTNDEEKTCHSSDQSTEQCNHQAEPQSVGTPHETSTEVPPGGGVSEGTDKTGLQTCLTINGLKTELASALEGTEAKGLLSHGTGNHGNDGNHGNELHDEEDALSSPDDFERELHEMLSSVQSGLQLEINTSPDPEAVADS